MTVKVLGTEGFHEQSQRSGIAPFSGQIADRATDSTPSFPAPVTAPEGAPNLLLVMLDDVGFGASSTFGGPIETPTLEGLAQRGLRYNKFHTTAMCSPTRAALLTGRNHHSAHTGQIMEMASGFPGYGLVDRAVCGGDGGRELPLPVRRRSGHPVGLGVRNRSSHRQSGRLRPGSAPRLTGGSPAGRSRPTHLALAQVGHAGREPLIARFPESGSWSQHHADGSGAGTVQPSHLSASTSHPRQNTGRQLRPAVCSMQQAVHRPR
jgi:hypothetical protein